MKKLTAIVLIVIFIGCVLSSLLILQSLNQRPSEMLTTTSTPGPIKRPRTDYGLPVRLKIPKLKVNAVIDQMGVTPQGDMQEPSEPQNVGWYKFGPRPGNKGSAVIAGHYGLNNDGAVFKQLHTLNNGDILQVVDEKGAIATFVVRESRTYNKDATVPEVFSSNDGMAHLNLITCQGIWQETQQTYSDRLVILADSSN